MWELPRAGTDPSAVADDYSWTQRKWAAESESIPDICAECPIGSVGIYITFIIWHLS